MKKILFLLFIYINIYSQTDSLKIKNYQNQLEQFKNAFNKRVEELVNQDPQCNQYKGAITVLQAIIDEEKKKDEENKEEVKKDN